MSKRVPNPPDAPALPAPLSQALQRLGLVPGRVLDEQPLTRVLEASDERLQRTVVLKIFDVDPQAGADLLREARLQAKLNHPHIVQVYQVLRTHEHLVLVMERVHGVTLAQHLAGGPHEFPERLRLARDLAAALAAAHDAGVIHGDLSAANVLVSARGEVKLIDFGLARARGGVPAEGRAGGTRSTLAPERLGGAPADERSDVFSLGVLLFMILTGTHPFAAPAQGSTSATELAQRVRRDARARFHDRLPDAPATLAEVVDAALAADPSGRPRSAQVLADRLVAAIGSTADLQQLLGERTVQVAAPLARPGRARRALLGLVVIAALGALAVTWQAHRRGHTRPLHLMVLDATAEASTTSAAFTVNATVAHALRQLVLSAPDLALLPTMGAVVAEGSALLRAAIAAGADELITHRTQCEIQRCIVDLQRVALPDGQVLSQRQWEVPTESYGNTFHSAQRQLAAAYPQRALTPGHLQGVDDAAYAQYLQVYERQQRERSATQADAQRVEGLLREHPYFFAAYSLYRELMLNRYDASRDGQVLDALRTTLAQAPAVYQGTVSHAIDSYWWAVTAGEYATAVAQLDLAVGRGVSASQAAELRANLAAAAGDLVASLSHYRRALALRPSVHVRYNLARILYKLGRLEEAVAALRRNLAALPDDLDSVNLLAALHLLRGELASAIVLFERQLRLSPSPIVLSNLSIAHVLDGAPERAIPFAQRAVDAQPQHPSMVLNLADALALAGQGEAARAEYRQVLALAGEDQTLQALLDRAQAYAHLGESAQAIVFIKQANALAPRSPDVALISAIVYARLGDLVSAHYHVEQALAQGLGAVWLRLPWFDALCGSGPFVRTLTTHAMADRCAPRPDPAAG